MKYELMIRSIPTAEIGIPETHARIVSAMNGISPPWGFGGRGGPPAPDCGRELLAESKLSKHLGPGVRGSIVYSYRAGLRDAGMSDDFMKIEFNPTRQNYQALVQEVFLNIYMLSRLILPLWVMPIGVWPIGRKRKMRDEFTVWNLPHLPRPLSGKFALPENIPEDARRSGHRAVARL